jgi:murein DD-endopeptidase MepM/ murein hydrolase activator NlpD
MNRSSDHMQNLADALSEDIVATPAAVLLAEVAEARGDRHAFAVDFDRIVGRAERRARWRGIVQRLRAMLPSLALRSSWRPALAAVACLAVIVVAGDLYLHVRPVGPTPMLASAPGNASRVAESRREEIAALPRLSLGEEPRADIDAGAPVAAPPPAPPPADIVSAPKRVHTMRIRGDADAPHEAPAARPVTAAATEPPAPPAQAQRSRAGAVAARTTPAPPPQSPGAYAAAPVPPPAPAVAALDRAIGDRDEVPSFAWPLRGQVIAAATSAKTGAHSDGIDITVPVGTDIRAAADGVVVYAGDGIKGYGNLVLLRHGGGFVTAYAHIDRILVKVNDAVQRGQVIAKSGRAGTTPLLHFEIRKGSAAIDPKQYLPPPG